ncbi:MAG: SDR family oxidoreductase [Chloroflexi bacterium]|nr:SDR family oxidoreductase [Chloroflexota bacterium]
MDFAGKRALVTGASRGIGKRVAEMLAEQGAHVAVHYNSGRSAAEATFVSLAGGGHALVQADIGDPQQVRRMVEEASAALGGIDILVNNAGIYNEHPVLSVSFEQWQADWNAILNTNLVGAANAIYWAVRHMPETGGAVVNVSSRGAFRGESAGPAYGASKAGMNSMGQSLAVALAPRNIHVITIAPGWVETDMAAEHLNGPSGDAIRNQSPFGRVASVDDVAYAVLVAAADQARFMSGTVIDVNGASYLRT